MSILALAFYFIEGTARIDVMRVLITSFLVLFGVMEMSHWIRHFTLPLPILILAGALLAIASNYGKLPGWCFPHQQADSDPHLAKTPKIEGITPVSSGTAGSKPVRSISFTIRRTTPE